MQYFTVLEDTRELRWQAELLFESIRLLELEDNFVIAICPGKGAINRHPYPNVIHFDNVGRKTGFPHFNKCYGLGKALASGVLKQPFVVLDTDMFLIKELEPSNAPVSAQNHKYLEWNNVREDLKEVTSGMDWTSLGGVYRFADVPTKVFSDIIKYTYELYSKFGNNKKFHTYGFTLGIVKNEIPFQRRNSYEMPLFNDRSPDINWSSAVIHYKEGYPPHFKKEGIFDTINFSFNLPLPLKCILECPIQDQPNVSAMQTLIRSWLDTNISRVWDLIN
jgi:hypothetical protein